MYTVDNKISIEKFFHSRNRNGLKQDKPDKPDPPLHKKGLKLEKRDKPDPPLISNLYVCRALVITSLALHLAELNFASLENRHFIQL